jgi:hypothetical protein
LTLAETIAKDLNATNPGKPYVASEDSDQLVDMAYVSRQTRWWKQLLNYSPPVVSIRHYPRAPDLEVFASREVLPVADAAATRMRDEMHIPVEVSLERSHE